MLPEILEKVTGNTAKLVIQSGGVETVHDVENIYEVSTGVYIIHLIDQEIK